MSHGTSALGQFIPSPPISSFHVGPLEIHFYALGYIIGITLAILITRRRWRALGGDPDLVNDLALWIVPAGIIGGRIYFDITTPDDIPHVWYGGFALWSGGGGVLGGGGPPGRHPARLVRGVRPVERRARHLGRRRPRGGGRRLAAAPARHHRRPLRQRHRPGAAGGPGRRPDRELLQQGA